MVHGRWNELRIRKGYFLFFEITLLVQLPHALQTINNYTQKATDSLNKATPLLFQGVGRPFVRQPIQYAGVPYP